MSQSTLSHTTADLAILLSGHLQVHLYAHGRVHIKRTISKLHTLGAW
jgi:hypothetical protein